MPIKDILRMGEKKLLQISEPVENITSEKTQKFLKSLLQDMQDTMSYYKGVGIAAPQIGINKRVILFGFEKNSRYPNEQPVAETFLINPSYRILSEETMAGLEGCLSVPGIRGSIRRYMHIQYSGYSIQNEKIERIISGFHARIIQHECDHLNGILFPFKIDDFHQFGFEDIIQWK